MINNVSKTSNCCGFRGRLSELRYSHLLLLQTGKSLWPRDGWVSGFFQVALSSLGVIFFTDQRFVTLPSAINPPPVGRTYNAYFDSAKALGPNQNTVRYQPLVSSTSGFRCADPLAMICRFLTAALCWMASVLSRRERHLPYQLPQLRRRLISYPMARLLYWQHYLA
jgi:hypothetical protein